MTALCPEDAKLCELAQLCGHGASFYPEIIRQHLPGLWYARCRSSDSRRDSNRSGQTGSEKSGIRLAAALVRGDKDTVEQIPESQRAQLVFGEDPLGIGQEVDPTAFCMELLQCADRGGIAL